MSKGGDAAFDGDEFDGDEFDGDSLDRSRWMTTYRWHAGKAGSRLDTSDEQQWYVDANVSVAGGCLRLLAERKSVMGERFDTPERFEFVSGMVCATTSFRFGHIEISARFPSDSGLWPALWLIPDDLSWPPEIDIVEVGGCDRRLSHTLHPTVGEPRQYGYAMTDPDEWHTYELDWQRELLVWSVDGVERFRVNEGIPQLDMYLVMNLAVGGAFSGGVDATTRFPAVMEVGHVRFTAQ